MLISAYYYRPQYDGNHHVTLPRKHLRAAIRIIAPAEAKNHMINDSIYGDNATAVRAAVVRRAFRIVAPDAITEFADILAFAETNDMTFDLHCPPEEASEKAACPYQLGISLNLEPADDLRFTIPTEVIRAAAKDLDLHFPEDQPNRPQFIFWKAADVIDRLCSKTHSIDPLVIQILIAMSRFAIRKDGPGARILGS